MRGSVMEKVSEDDTGSDLNDFIADDDEDEEEEGGEKDGSSSGESEPEPERSKACRRSRSRLLRPACEMRDAIGSVRIRSCQVRSDQIRSGQIRSGQVRSGQVGRDVSAFNFADAMVSEGEWLSAASPLGQRGIPARSREVKRFIQGWGKTCIAAGYQRQRAPPFTEAVLRAHVDLWDADAEAATDAAGHLRMLMRRTALLCCYRAVARGVDSLRERWEGVRVNAP